MTPPVITTSVQSSNRFLKSKITKTNCGSTIIRDSQQPYQQLIPKGVGLVQYVPPSATYVSTRRNHLLRFPILYGISKIPSDVLLLCYLYLENLTKARSLWGSASREFLEKPEHFSHPTIDLLALLENGVLKSFHPFGVRCHVIPYSSFKSGVRMDCIDISLGVCVELGAGVGRDPFSKKLIWSSSSRSLRSEGEVLNNFPRFVGILIAEFAAGGAVNLALKMKGDMIIKNLDRSNDHAMMIGLLEEVHEERVHAIGKRFSMMLCNIRIIIVEF
ncbi:hypothetical protein Tco_1507114 [Tanacetum coccineum]